MPDCFVHNWVGFQCTRCGISRREFELQKMGLLKRPDTVAYLESCVAQLQTTRLHMQANDTVPGKAARELICKARKEMNIIWHIAATAPQTHHPGE